MTMPPDAPPPDRKGFAVASHGVVMARAAVLFRVLIGVLSLAQVAIWWSWTWAHPWTLAGPLAAAGWTVIVAVLLARNGLDPRISSLELAFAGPLACFGALLVPPATVGDASNWVYVTVGGVTVTAAWCLPVRAAVPAVASVAAAYWAGAAMVGPSGPAPGVPVRSVVLLAVITTVWALAVRTCRAHAADADIDLVAAVRRYRIATITQSRTQDRREQERIVHDTLVNTLTGIAMNSAQPLDPVTPTPTATAPVPTADIRNRCADDLAVLETFLARGASRDGTPAAAAAARAALAHDSGRLIRTGHETGLARGVAVFIVCWHAAMALPAVTMAQTYRWPLVSLVVWLGLAALAVRTVPAMIRRGLRGRESAGLLGAAVLAELLVGLTCRGYNVVGFANWALLGAGWLLVATAVSRPTREALLGATTVTVLATVLALREVGPVPLALARLVAVTWGLWVPALAVTVIRRAMAAAGPTVARTVATEADRSALEVAAAAVRADRARRWDILATRTLPLVRAIADGLLDPADEAVRSRCAAQAATLRRMLAGTTATDLEHVIASAERRGLRVETQLAGDLRDVPAQARSAIARIVDESLASVATGRVLLTVLGGTDEAQVFVSFPAPVQAVQAIPIIDPGCHLDGNQDGHLDALADMVDGRGSLELRWSR
ncbi:MULTISPECIES: hypothetical protein [unclassified Frankia]|uniref:hypothetical protein n=1 Tax=unclassified Frankia TaxID=2632575 RepID=UPI002AD1EBB7|nr:MULTISPECIES: hypothetical protein [unclassified Frankia]